MTDYFNKYIDDAKKTALPSSDEEEDIEDGDTCSIHELATQFCIKYKPQDEKVVSLKKDYVLSLCADENFTRIVAGLSSTAVHIYNMDGSGLTEIHAERVPNVGNVENLKKYTICGVHFLDETPEILLVGTTDGVVRLFDLRASGEQARFEYQADANSGDKAHPEVPRSMLCFDRNANGRVICSGTENYKDNAFLVFYDVRERKQLATNFDCHEDDITTVLFHPNNVNLMCSGSMDGLINLYDITQGYEDEILENTYNTEKSVHKLNWHNNIHGKDVVSCTTYSGDFHSYDCHEGDELVAFERSDITEGIRRKNSGNFNLINAHNLKNGEVFLLAGTNFHRGEILRSMKVTSKETLNPLANFVGNKQIVRESLYNANRDILVTGGESGILTVWTPDTGSDGGSSKLKTKTKSKSHKTNPY